MWRTLPVFAKWVSDGYHPGDFGKVYLVMCIKDPTVFSTDRALQTEINRYTDASARSQQTVYNQQSIKTPNTVRVRQDNHEQNK
jgi:hypothetical protein